MNSGRDTIRFVLDDAVVEERNAAATTTVLEYLRDTLGRTGTKEGCAEGDCGACTVVLGRLGADEQIEYRAINSCIRFLPTIDGQELITCESLAGDELHPVQQAMVDQHGSQCGFCTPGFVMSLFALYLQNVTPSREAVVDSLAGNLCRCTGYRPIIDAGVSMPTYPSPRRWSREDAQSDARRQQLQALRRDESLVLPEFHAPRTIAELAASFEAMPDSLLLAGGTDIGLWSTKQLRALPSLIYIGEITELRSIEDRGDAGTWIGAAVLLAEAWPAVVTAYPELAELSLRFASPPVCNSGTLCGNIANGSPIGDSMPILIALNARVELRRGTAVRELPLEQFYLGYRRNDLAPGEFVSGIVIPKRRNAMRVASYKAAKRFDQDISSVCLGIVLELDGSTVATARVAFGGMAATPARAPATEQALIGAPWAMQSIEHAVAALRTDFQPITDMRASSDYRLRVAGSFLRRFFLANSGGEAARLNELRAALG